MKKTVDSHDNRHTPVWVKTGEIVAILLWEIWVLPLRWRCRLRRSSVPVLLEEIEGQIKQARLLSLSPHTIACLVRLRIGCTIHWRRSRCLLSSLLLLYFLARTQRIITLHLQCRLNDGNQLAGHCWISGPGLEQAAHLMPSEGHDEIYRKTIGIGRCTNFTSRAKNSYVKAHPSDKKTVNIL